MQLLGALHDLLVLPNDVGERLGELVLEFGQIVVLRESAGHFLGRRQFLGGRTVRLHVVQKLRSHVVLISQGLVEANAVALVPFGFNSFASQWNSYSGWGSPQILGESACSCHCGRANVLQAAHEHVELVANEHGRSADDPGRAAVVHPDLVLRAHLQRVNDLVVRECLEFKKVKPCRVRRLAVRAAHGLIEKRVVDHNGERLVPLEEGNQGPRAGGVDAADGPQELKPTRVEVDALGGDEGEALRRALPELLIHELAQPQVLLPLQLEVEERVEREGVDDDLRGGVGDDVVDLARVLVADLQREHAHDVHQVEHEEQADGVVEQRRQERQRPRQPPRVVHVAHPGELEEQRRESHPILHSEPRVHALGLNKQFLQHRGWGV